MIRKEADLIKLRSKLYDVFSKTRLDCHAFCHLFTLHNLGSALTIVYLRPILTVSISDYFLESLGLPYNQSIFKGN